MRPPRWTLAVLLETACVSEPAPLTKGAAGFTVEPNSAARGESFVTEDGWTVRIETLLLRAGVAPHDGGDFYVWNAAAKVSLFAPGIAAGRRQIWFALSSNGYGRIQTIAVNEFDRDRFAAVADDAQADSSHRSPSLSFRIRADRDGRTVIMDLALRSDPAVVRLPQEGLPGDRVEVDVGVDQLTLVPFTLVGEKLVRRLDETRLAFDPFAVADDRGDADGRITVAELRASPAIPYAKDRGTPYTPPKLTLLEDLQLRAANLLRP